MNPGKLTLSFHEADRRLPRRNGTTAALVAAGRLAAVPWGKRQRVLAADVDRIAAEGFTIDLRRPRQPRRKATTAGVGARILAIPIPEVTP